MTEFVTFRDRLYQASPVWLRGWWGSRLLYAIGLMFDSMIEWADMVVHARYAEWCALHAPDGLAVHGRDRGIRRGVVESATAYAVRLGQWWSARKQKGAPFALMRQLQGYLTGHEVSIRCVNPQGAWQTLSYQGVAAYYRATSTNWDWDGVAANWSRYWVILYPPETLWTDDGTWDDPGTWDDGGTWDSTATPDQVASVRAIVAEWNPPHARCANIVLAFDPGAFRPNESGAGFPAGDWGTWGHSVAGNYEAVRLGTASYWDGV